ncbi:UV DNA damage repair endonuclease UvsE [Alkalibacterium thalassium]|uniref:UV-damage endonuclease n=1 Tax=Alkalibacterium thalassium TaxID=426701 RepID=A0A1G9A438_9LACT|nr:UV DNA damage repair endonuclease UvsE [Alkalibacterium thalassium]SDK22132.1 UV-damage endonuclease [Alkalibacterium thalassium]
MSIGYACLTRGIADLSYKTCRKQNATEENLLSLIEHNLTTLEAMIDYNNQNDIRLFRMSSDIIPFGSDFSVNDLDWSQIFKEQFERIGEKVKDYGIRVSMHPGQYTVLNSKNEDVVNRAIDDLTYHTLFIDSLNVDASHKIILHIGGVYGDKDQAIERFVKVYKKLDQRIKKRLIIENDDRLYTIEDVLSISQQTGAPVVYDNLHHFINPGETLGNDKHWIEKAQETWSLDDGRAKVHYSQQQLNAREGAHSQTVRIKEFMDYYESVKSLDIDIMLEVKDKNLSAVKCVLATKNEGAIKDLEKEWSRYKYAVLERSPQSYQFIRELLKDKDKYPVVPFYEQIEEAMETPLSIGGVRNAIEHVWGYFNDKVSEKEKNRYVRYKEEVLSDVSSLPKLKRMLRKLAVKYDISYLIESYYFDI